ncbi:MAG: hypothetical protein H6742_09050 [Alphaproteobacteria bacterium]|nr:hypothetical protein [Alphaproteobacteria bacterium]
MSPLLLLLLSCNDSGFSRFNGAPTATITSHQDGDDLLQGQQITVRGTAGDADDQASTLSASWYVGDERVCDGVPDDDGRTSCVLSPTPDAPRVTLEVIDPEGASATATVTFDVTPNAAPTVQIVAPTDTGRYYQDQRIALTAIVADAEDETGALTLSWRGDETGDLGTAPTADSAGETTLYADLEAGEHVLTATVTDSLGNTGTDTVALTVGPDNRAPTCAITSPASGGASGETEYVPLAALVGDEDQGPTGLTLAITSSIDGTVASPTANADGSVNTSLTDLTVGVHTLTLQVTDEREASCNDSITWTVGSGPEVVITAPGDGSRVADGATVSLQATASDDEDSGPELSLSWTSSIDGTLGTVTPDSGGASTLAISSLSPGTHVLTATALDTTGLTGSDSISLVVNQPPGAPDVSITPSSPKTADELGVVIDTDAVDPEGDSLTYAYTWFKNDVEATSWTGTTVDASATRKGQTWRVEVVASDGVATGPAGSAEVTIGNTAPSVTSVGINPSTLYTDSTATAEVVTTDADGDGVSLSYSWKVDGAAAGTDSSSLSGDSWFDKGQGVVVTVTPSDGSGTGTAVSSSSVTVRNSPPTAPTVEIVPGDPVEGEDDLICNIVSAPDDADGDPVDTFITWEVDGAAFEDASTTDVARDTVLAAETVADELWTCVVTPDDGEDEGDPGTDSVLILSGDIDYSGTWNLDSSISYTCAYGLVSMNFSRWSISEDDPDISLTSVGSGVPGTVVGAFDTDTAFIASRTIAGTCTETYTVEAEFTDADTLEGTLEARFTGSLCLGCTTRSWSFTATR